MWIRFLNIAKPLSYFIVVALWYKAMKEAEQAKRDAEAYFCLANDAQRMAEEDERKTTAVVDRERKRANDAEKFACDQINKIRKQANAMERRYAERIKKLTLEYTSARNKFERVFDQNLRFNALNSNLQEVAQEASDRAREAENRAREAEEMAELAVINGSNGECFERFKCPITQSLIKDPVITCDGHTYEREAIEKWFVMHDTSPLTNVELDSKVLVPNHAVRTAIEVYVLPIKAYVPPHRRGW